MILESFYQIFLCSFIPREVELIAQHVELLATRNLYRKCVRFGANEKLDIDLLECIRDHCFLNIITDL